MHYIKNLTILILIFNLKLNIFNAIPLINANEFSSIQQTAYNNTSEDKPSLSSNSDNDADSDSDVDSSNNKNYNRNNNVTAINVQQQQQEHENKVGEALTKALKRTVANSGDKNNKNNNNKNKNIDNMNNMNNKYKIKSIKSYNKNNYFIENNDENFNNTYNSKKFNNNNNNNNNNINNHNNNNNNKNNNNNENENNNISEIVINKNENNNNIKNYNDNFMNIDYDKKNNIEWAINQNTNHKQKTITMSTTTTQMNIKNKNKITELKTYFDYSRIQNATTTTETNFNTKEKILKQTKYFYYDHVQNATTKLQLAAIVLMPTATATATTTAITELAKTNPVLPITTTKNITENYKNEHANDERDTLSADDIAGFSNNLKNNDLDRMLLQYENDDGNVCLMDGLKDNLIWWAHVNGTLRMMDNHFKSRSSYLDLSFRNATDDDNLYFKARQQTLLLSSAIVAFSAANNDLTQAPYRTLTLMNATLKYLTLKGNQFASYIPHLPINAGNRTRKDFPEHGSGNNSSNPPFQFFHTHTNAVPNTSASYCNIDHTEQQQQQPQDYRRSTIASPADFVHYKKNFKKIFERKGEGIDWAQFPPMPALLELDISQCNIEFIVGEVFQNFTNLRRLYLGHNKMLTIPFDTFQHVTQLQYLDLSSTNVLDHNYQLPLSTLDTMVNLMYGLKIQSTTFTHLPDLVYLDLSHTKLTRNSAVAFTHLGEKLKYLSLCYTGFPMVGNAIFKNTALKALDLSGNPYAAYSILEDAFVDVADTLHFLYFEHSNIKDLAWLKHLHSLRVLSLAGNNINSVSLSTFGLLNSLQVLDLSSNHIGNWYNRAFTHNTALRILNMRDNNINIITSEMLKDFQFLEYLSLGDNNFVCDCLLRDLVDVAAANNKNADCSRDILQEAVAFLHENAHAVGRYWDANATLYAGKALVKVNPNSLQNATDFIVAQHVLQRYVPMLRRSYANFKASNYTRKRLNLRFFRHFYRVLKSDVGNGTTSTKCPPPESVLIYDKLNGSTLKFQLLDYEDEHYWCFNETERIGFVQLQCEPRAYADNLRKELHQLTRCILGILGALIGIFILGSIVYMKRWHIQYYYTTLKSAALVSVATKSTTDKFKQLAEQDPNLIYDIFLSYCENDRQWVLDELLPNVEDTADISICMHERDFQIGVTIVDNITSCMDRSRAFMLVVSKNFLLSHWCQFEMYLAQHRLFDASKEHLIIVLLEDIPRSKRSKTLQYLMDVKTYIKWPTKAEEKKFFWKRLRRSLEHIGLSSRESHA